VAIGSSPPLARFAQPLVQVVASIPATALFPVILLLLIHLRGGMEIAAMALMLLGTQWYILFNVVAGAMAIPTDLKEAALVYRFSRFERWRRLIFARHLPLSDHRDAYRIGRRLERQHRCGIFSFSRQDSFNQRARQHHQPRQRFRTLRRSAGSYLGNGHPGGALQPFPVAPALSPGQLALQSADLNPASSLDK